MSQYKFKRKNVESDPKQENRIMNANATPEESTTVFSRTSETPTPAPEEYVPFEEDDEVVEAPKKKSIFASFVKSKKTEDGEVEESDKDDIISKAEDIINGSDISVDDIKEAGNGKKVNLAEVFSRKKTEVMAEAEEENPFEADESNNDEDTPEASTEFNEGEAELYGDPAPKKKAKKIKKTNNVKDVDEEEDIYEEEENGDVDIPMPPKPKKQKKVREIREYNSPDEKEDFTEIYTKKKRISVLALIFSLISTLALIYLETKALPRPEWLLPGKYGFLYLMFDLQFVLISGVCVLSAIIDGAARLFTWKPNKNSITFITLAVSVIQILLHLILNKYSKDISLYSSVFSLCALITVAVNYIDIRREQAAFNIASSVKTKTVITALDEGSVEYSSFSEYLPENASMYKVSKASFVTDFFKTVNRTSVYNDNYKITIPLVLAASVVFAILSVTLSKDATLGDAINSFALTFMMGLPMSSLFIVSLPFYITSHKLSKSRSAILGEAAIEDYANAPLVSFLDTDVFNPKGVTISSIKTYGKTRIDNTYLYTAKVFKMVGGPLDEVFDRSVINFDKKTDGNSILSVTENGINATIDEKSVLIGNQDFMIESGLNVIDDADDKKATESANVRILYVAINGEISAKFYIKYMLGVKFKKLLDSFCNLGICIAVNTRDPNIDTEFLLSILKDKDYPIVAVKNTDLPQIKDGEPAENASGGIVSVSSVYDVLRTFIAADKLSHVISINTLTKYIALIFAFTLIVVAFITGGSHEKITPLFIMLYQLVWSLPIIGTSIFG